MHVVMSGVAHNGRESLLESRLIPRSAAASVLSAGTVAESSAVGVTYGGPSGASIASTLLRNVKQEVEIEEDSGKKKKSKGGGKRERSGNFGDTSKSLIKKGIVDLDSHSHNGKLHVSDHELEAITGQGSLPCSQVSSAVSTPTHDGHSYLSEEAVQVVGESVGMGDDCPSSLESESTHCPSYTLCNLDEDQRANKQAFSPNSGYGHFMRSMQEECPRSDSSSTSRIEPLGKSGLNRSDSDRSSIFESIKGTCEHFDTEYWERSCNKGVLTVDMNPDMLPKFSSEYKGSGLEAEGMFNSLLDQDETFSSNQSVPSMSLSVDSTHQGVPSEGAAVSIIEVNQCLPSPRETTPIKHHECSSNVYSVSTSEEQELKNQSCQQAHQLNVSQSEKVSNPKIRRKRSQSQPQPMIAAPG